MGGSRLYYLRVDREVSQSRTRGVCLEQRAVSYAQRQYSDRVLEYTFEPQVLRNPHMFGRLRKSRAVPISEVSHAGNGDDIAIRVSAAEEKQILYLFVMYSRKINLSHFHPSQSASFCFGLRFPDLFVYLNPVFGWFLSCIRHRHLLLSPFWGRTPCTFLFSAFFRPIILPFLAELLPSRPSFVLLLLPDSCLVSAHLENSLRLV